MVESFRERSGSKVIPVKNMVGMKIAILWEFQREVKTETFKTCFDDFVGGDDVVCDA